MNTATQERTTAAGAPVQENTTALMLAPSYMPLAEVERWGTKAFKSQLFKETGLNEFGLQLIVQTANELGITPMAGLQYIYVVKGKAFVGYVLQAALIMRSRHVRYKVVTSTATECVLAFYRLDFVENKWEKAGESHYTMDDAKKQELDKNPNYRKIPSTMMFARSMTNGVKRFCPEILFNAAPSAEVGVGDAANELDRIIQETAQPVDRQYPEGEKIPDRPEGVDTTDNAGAIDAEEVSDQAEEVSSISPEEKARFDLLIGVEGLLQELSGGDEKKLEALKKGREPNRMPVEKLKKFYQELWDVKTAG